jgi:LmbE family N-acetylglucosaminyl deacetylase
MLPAEEVRRVLVVTAHPDDVDFGAAGTIATLTDAGVEVTYAIITSGDAGEAFPETPRSEVGALREAEQTAAAKCVGVSDVRYLRYADGTLTPTIQLRKDISRVIRQVRPDLMIIPSPERNMERIYASHPDHLAAGEAAFSAIYPDARNPWAHRDLATEEGLEAWTVRETWVMASGSTKDSVHAVDITDVFDRKLAALQAHASQTNGMTDLENMLRQWGLVTASHGGLAAGRLAEAFQIVDTR